MAIVSVSNTVPKNLGNIQKAIQRGLPKAVLKAANFAGAEIRDQVLSTAKDQTGALARSFLPAKPVVGSNGLAAEASSELPYARVQDQGTRDKPIKAKSPRQNVAIPLTPEAKNKWPRDWPKDTLSAIPSKKAGKALLIEKRKGKRGRNLNPRVHYVLQPEVHIQGKDYIQKALGVVTPKVLDIVGADVKLMIKKR